MGNQNATKVDPEVIAAFEQLAEKMALVGASIDEVIGAADKLRQTFLDIYTKEALKKIKV